MKQYVLDANAVLRFFGVSGTPGAEAVRRLFQQAESGRAHLAMSVVNVGEVLYILLRHVGEAQAQSYLHALQHAVTIVDADLQQTIHAAKLKHAHKLGYADSFATALAIGSAATLVSADPVFAKLGKSVKWQRLPPHDSSR